MFGREGASGLGQPRTEKSCPPWVGGWLGLKSRGLGWPWQAAKEAQMPAGPSHLSVSTRSLLSGSFRFLKKQSRAREGLVLGPSFSSSGPHRPSRGGAQAVPSGKATCHLAAAPWSLPFSMHQLCALGGVGMWGRPSSGPRGHTGPLSEGSRDREPILYFCTFCFYFRRKMSWVWCLGHRRGGVGVLWTELRSAAPRNKCLTPVLVSSLLPQLSSFSTVCHPPSQVNGSSTPAPLCRPGHLLALGGAGCHLGGWASGSLARLSGCSDSRLELGGAGVGRSENSTWRRNTKTAEQTEGGAAPAPPGPALWVGEPAGRPQAACESPTSQGQEAKSWGRGARRPCGVTSQRTRAPPGGPGPSAWHLAHPGLRKAEEPPGQGRN